MNTELLDQEGQEQRPEHQTVCEVLQREANWKCLILTLLIAGCLGAVTWCRLTEITKVIINFSVYPIKSTQKMSPCDDGYIYIPVAFMAMLYLVYLVECWHCTARIQLGHQADLSGVTDRVLHMREAQPIVWWKAVCYHYVRRKRHVTRYRHGDTYTTSQAYYERVNSHAAAARFQHTYCGVRDVSRSLVLDARGPIIKIKFSKGYAFANMAAAAEFSEQRSRFFSEHERYDDYMEMREGLDLSGVTFRESVVAAGRRPWYSDQRVFWLASGLLLSWPLRLLLEYNTAHVHYQVTKLFGVNYEIVSRGTTVDSDLDRRINANTSLVPSYSEALLMEAPHSVPPTYSAYMTSQISLPAVHRPSSVDLQAAPPNKPITTLVGQPAETSAEIVLGRYRRSWGGISSLRLQLARSTTQYRLASSNDSEPTGRRSLGSILESRCLSRSTTHIRLNDEDVEPDTQSSQAADDEERSERRVMIYPSPLVERCPTDPFGGRSETTPTEDPPRYDDALRLPALARLRRSLTWRSDGVVGETRGWRNISMETSL